MKDSKAIIIEFKNLEDLENELLDLKKKKTLQVYKNILFFDSVSSFRNFMTLQKLEILALIANDQPKSVYDLTQMLDRGLAAVQKDCQMLERLGFIFLKKQDTRRGNLKPLLVFDYDRIIVHLPQHPYELQFRAA